MPRLRSLLLALPLLATTACHASIPPYSVNVPPRLDNIRPPRSVAFLHDEIPLGPLRDAIARAIPKEIAGTKKTTVGGLRELDFAWKLDRRPVVLRADATGLVLEVALAGNVSASGTGVRCHAEDASITFRTETRPGFRPGGEIGFDHLDWKPATHGNMRCDGFIVPVDTVLNLIVGPLAHALATLVGKIELPTGPLVRKALDEMQPARSFKLDAKSDDVCLDLAPDAVVLSPIGGTGGSAMTLKLGVEVAPRIVLGACPTLPQAPKASASKVVAKSIPLKDHFEVAVAVAVPYTELATLAAPAVVGHRFGNAEHGITVDSIELADTNGRTLAHLRVHGTLDGDVYLWGTPTIVEEKGRFVMRMPDLQLAVESQSVLERMALAAWKAVGGDLVGTIKNSLVLDVTDRLAQTRAALSGRRELAQGSLVPVLTTSLQRIRPGDVTSKPGVLILMPVLVGEAEFSVESR